jgi:S1-C subfamily serine protease
MGSQRHRLGLSASRASARSLAAGFCLVSSLAFPGVSLAGTSNPTEDALASVAVVHTLNSIGTAFAVGNGELLTAAHVVTGQHSVQLTVGTTLGTATVVKVSTRLDVAVLKTRMTIPPLSLSPTSPAMGENVYAVGAALGDLSITRGVISGQRSVGGFPHLQTDAAVNEGNSGGPIIDSSGSVLGLVVSKVRDAEGIGLAVPATVLRSFLKGSLPAAQDVSEPADPTAQHAASQLWWLAVPLAGALLLMVTTRRRRFRPRRITVHLDGSEDGTPIALDS